MRQLSGCACGVWVQDQVSVRRARLDSPARLDLTDYMYGYGEQSKVLMSMRFIMGTGR